MAYETPSALICSDLALGWQTAMDLSVSIQPISMSADIRRTWNGRAINVADDAFRLYAVRLSSGQAELRAPALSKLWPGVIFDLVPSTELVDKIGVGGATVTLSRPPYAGSVRCLDAGHNDIPFTVSGSIVTLAAPASAQVRVFFRPVLTCMVVAPWTQSLKEVTAEVAWELSAEEVGGTL